MPPRPLGRILEPRTSQLQARLSASRLGDARAGKETSQHLAASHVRKRTDQAGHGGYLEGWVASELPESFEQPKR